MKVMGLDAQSGAVGTLHYMAPEALAGRECTQSVDVFSFGVVCAELWLQARPYAHDMPPHTFVDMVLNHGLVCPLSKSH